MSVINTTDRNFTKDAPHSQINHHTKPLDLIPNNTGVAHGMNMNNSQSHHVCIVDGRDLTSTTTTPRYSCHVHAHM
jgi:hypothetical protein